MKSELARYINDFNNCIVIRKDRDKAILKAPAVDSDNASWFVKIYFTPGITQRLRNFICRNLGGIRDYRICKELQLRGIPVPDPVGGFADHPLPGLAQHTVFACKWINNAPSVQILMRHLGSDKRIRANGIIRKKREVSSIYLDNQIDFFPPCPEWMNEFNTALGKFVATLHKRGVYSNDLNVGNILVQNPGLDFRFLLIDYEGIAFKRKVSRSRCFSNLIQVAAFMSQLTEYASLYLCQGYASVQHHFNSKETVGLIENRALILQKKWQQWVDLKIETIVRNLHRSGS